jgi:hypothetical protein
VGYIKGKDISLGQLALYASHYGWPETADYVCSNDDVSGRALDQNGQNVFHFAMGRRKGQPNVIKVLQKYQVGGVNDQDGDGDIPLYLANFASDEVMEQLLVSRDLRLDILIGDETVLTRTMREGFCHPRLIDADDTRSCFGQRLSVTLQETCREYTRQGADGRRS